MLRVTMAFLAATALIFSADRLAQAQQPLKSYPITLKADDVHEFEELSIASNGLQLSGEELRVVPIRCEVGVTGAMVLGKGKFRFEPREGEAIEGEFRCAMLRFSPEDQQAVLPLDKGKVTTDYASHEMSRHLLNGVFGHCYHRGMEALIPDRDAFAANFYSTTHGDLLISTTPQEQIAHNFTTKKTLYKGK